MQTDGKHGVMPLCSSVISLSFTNMLGMLTKCSDKVTDRMTMYILTAAGAPLDYNMLRHNNFLAWQLRLRASSRSGTNLKLLWISHHTFFGSHQSCQELKIYFTNKVLKTISTGMILHAPDHTHSSLYGIYCVQYQFGSLFPAFSRATVSTGITERMKQVKENNWL